MDPLRPVLLVAATLLAVACGVGSEKDPEPASTLTTATTASSGSEYVESFEVAWATVNDADLEFRLVGPPGLEPGTSSLSGMRSNRAELWAQISLVLTVFITLLP